MRVRNYAAADEAWATQLWRENWGGTRVVTKGRLHSLPALPGLVAERDGEAVGVVSYLRTGGGCEIVSLAVANVGSGIGTMLVEALEARLGAEAPLRLWLVTTNDNTRAFRFWQGRGYLLTAVHLHALEGSRQLKPEIPLTGADGIPIRDELELAKELAA